MRSARLPAERFVGAPRMRPVAGLPSRIYGL